MSPVSSEFCLILVTTPNATCAKAIATTLLQEKLAACINCFSVESFYTWEDELNRDHEFQLTIKTRTALFDKLSARVAELHPYETPEIIALPILAGAPTYLNWIEQSTQATVASAD